MIYEVPEYLKKTYMMNYKQNDIYSILSIKRGRAIVNTALFRVKRNFILKMLIFSNFLI